MDGRCVGESEVSDGAVSIPEPVREALDLEDGDALRWRLDRNEELRVEVVRREPGTFADFEGYDGTVETDADTDHDEWGVE